MEPIYATGKRQSADGSVRVEMLTPPQDLGARDGRSTTATGKPTPARVHFRAPDGRYLPPYGHRHEVNDNWFEDYGADLKLGSTAVRLRGRPFQIELPVGDVYVEVAKGFEYGRCASG